MVADAELRDWVEDASARLLESVCDLEPEQLAVPYLPTLNLPLWEVCHAAHFLEYWVLREALGQAPAKADGDALFNSMTVGHETRWRLPTPDLDGTTSYVHGIRDRVLEALDAGLDELQPGDDARAWDDERTVGDRLRYLIAYSVFHADMHVEAIAYCRQSCALPAPRLGLARGRVQAGDALGDVAIPGGELLLGATDDGAFCFDNEKWGHAVQVPDFAMAKAAVTEGEFAAFVADGGYTRRELWSAEGWAWLQSEQVELPLFWRRAGSSYERRVFDTWVPLDPGRAMMHVCWFEADAYCRWAKRRLPTEAEWELAASTMEKRRYPWGDDAPDASRANLDAAHTGAVDASAYPAGDSADGLCQLLGNVWEWTSTTFAPFPGFEADMYVDYSQTSFHTRKVLRGGCWITRARMIRNTWRNYYPEWRRDVFAGFRTCAP